MNKTADSLLKISQCRRESRQQTRKNSKNFSTIQNSYSHDKKSKPLREKFHPAKCLSFSKEPKEKPLEKKFAIKSREKKKGYIQIIHKRNKVKYPVNKEYSDDAFKSPDILKQKKCVQVNPLTADKILRKKHSSFLHSHQKSKKISQKLTGYQKYCMPNRTPSFAEKLVKRFSEEGHTNLENITVNEIVPNDPQNPQNSQNLEKSLQNPTDHCASFRTVVNECEEELKCQNKKVFQRKKEKSGYSKIKRKRDRERDISGKRGSFMGEKGYMKTTISFNKSKQREAIHLNKKFEKREKAESLEKNDRSGVKEKAEEEEKEKDEHNLSVKPKSSLETFVYSSKVLTTKKNPRMSLSFLTKQPSEKENSKSIKRNYNKPWLDCIKPTSTSKSSKPSSSCKKPKPSTARSVSIKKSQNPSKTPQNPLPKLTITTASSVVRSPQKSSLSKSAFRTNRSSIHAQSELRVAVNTPNTMNLEKGAPRTSKFECLRKRQYRKLTHYARPCSAFTKKVNADLYDLFDIEE